MLEDGTTSFSHTIDVAKSVDFEVKNKYIIRISKDASPSNELNVPNEWQLIDIQDSIEQLVLHLFEISQSTGVEQNCIAWADNIFQYAPLFSEIFVMHKKYHAHYSFAEGYPIGISPEFLSNNAIAMLKSILEVLTPYEKIGTDINRSSLFKVIEQRINDFDIEALLSKEDLREYRWSFTGDTRRNFVIGKKLWQLGMRDPNELLEYFKKYPECFRGVPSYINIQVSTTVHQSIYLPDNLQEKINQLCKQSYMPISDFESYITRIHEYSPESVVSLGYNGEIFAHPQIEEILQIVTKYFSTIYIETKGMHWEQTKAASWWKEDWIKQLIWIVSVDAFNENTYEIIHGLSITNVQHFIAHLLENTLPDNIYVQAVRMQENEHELELFIKYWKNEKVNPIVQKYNDYCKTLPDRKVVDLAPITRHPCFHLGRDLVVTVDGNVLMCSQALSTEYIIGNLDSQELEDIWNNNNLNYKSQVNNNFLDLCKECDEYYIFNA